MSMPAEILEYLKSQRVGVIAIEMMDGSPHAATVHFGNTDEPVFLFMTSRRYRKSEALLGKESCRASFVVGLTEAPVGEKEKTFQSNGTAKVITESAMEKYFVKFPEKKAKSADPDNLFFSFTPTWWRFTDWGGKDGKTITNSDGTVVVTPKK